MRGVECGLQILRLREQRSQGRLQRINHGAIAFVCAAVELHLRQSRIQGFGNASSLFQFLPRSGKENRHQHTAGTAHHHGQTFANQREQRGKVIQRQLLAMQQTGNFTRASGKGRTGIAIADFGVQRIKMSLQIGKGCGDKFHNPGHQGVRRRLEFHACATLR